MDFDVLLEMSHRYGADERYGPDGGGYVSCKEDDVMHINSYGEGLSDISRERFVAMDMQPIREMFDWQCPADISDGEIEKKTLLYMLEARLPGEEGKRPAVESSLHVLFPYKFVLHVHPAIIDGLSCGVDGESYCRRLFGDKVVWVDLVKPGLLQAQQCHKALSGALDKTGVCPRIAIIKNHGMFVAADTAAQIDELMEYAIGEVKGHVTDEPCFEDAGFDRGLACSIAPALRMLFSGDGKSCAVFCVNKQILGFITDTRAFKPLCKPFMRDNIKFCGDEPLFIEPDADIGTEFKAYVARKGFKPRIVAVRGLGVFALGKDWKSADQARSFFLDAVKIAVYAGAFGGVCPLPDEFTTFILVCEAGKYWDDISHDDTPGGRLEGRIAIVTGGAQGFGKGIAEALASEGAYLAIADLNPDGATECSSQLGAVYGAGTAVPVSVDVSDEQSVERMVQETVLTFGGLDILVSNAGVLVAGGLGDMTKKSFDFVTRVNYTGYFLCAKYTAQTMKIQNMYAPGYMMDIIEINSKSGLEGSNRNFAYAGSKFGGIGLTQSFALELVQYGIKVNAICPGNLLDGPLWSDPERGLFKQYLDSGKVAGAKTIGDVRRFYEAKVPMKRGCTIQDVIRAIIYVIEQEYETGQAVPVTGGQIMLR